MSASLRTNRIAIKDISSTTIVANNPKARLMYYLNCVSVVLNTDKLDRYTNYQEYYNIPDEEIGAILILAILFNPKIMVESKVFILDPIGDYGNAFLEITNEQFGIHANEEIIIGGVSVKVRKLMLFSESWLKRNYFEPLTEIDKKRPLSLDKGSDISDDDKIRPQPEKRKRIDDDEDCTCKCIIF